MHRREIGEYEPLEIYKMVKDRVKAYKWMPAGYERKDLESELHSRALVALPDHMVSRGELSTFINAVVDFDYKDLWEESKAQKRESDSFGTLTYMDEFRNEIAPVYQTRETQQEHAENRHDGVFTKITWSRGATGQDDNIDDTPINPLDYKEMDSADIDDGHEIYIDWPEDDIGEIVEDVKKYTLPGRDLGYKTNKSAPDNIGCYNRLEVFKPYSGDWLLESKHLRLPAQTKEVTSKICKATCKNRLEGETVYYDLPHAAQEVYRGRFSDFYHLNKWKIVDEYKVREIKDAGGNVIGGTKLGGLVRNDKGQLVKPLLDCHVTKDDKRTFSIDDYETVVIQEDQKIVTEDEDLIRIINSDKRFIEKKKKAERVVSRHKQSKYVANFDYLMREYGSDIKEVKYKNYTGLWTDLFNDYHRTMQAASRGDIEAVDVIIDIHHGISWLNEEEKKAVMLWFQGYEPYNIRKILKHKSNNKTKKVLESGKNNLKKFLEKGKKPGEIPNNNNGGRRTWEDPKVKRQHGLTHCWLADADPIKLNHPATGAMEWLNPEYESEPIERKKTYKGKIIKAKNPAGKVTEYEVISENDYIIQAKSLTGGYIECFTRNMLEYKEGMIEHEVI